MKSILLIISGMPSLLFGQTDTNNLIDSAHRGIRFEQGKTWNQVLSNAKSENKYVFVDCYTTWCGPCKEMDKSVYPQEKVGDYCNAKFISVKMQMDTSAKDDETVKNLYADASAINKRYALAGYPSYLFFTPDGKIISRGLGAKSPDEFLKMASDALNPEKDYYKLLGEFKSGKRDFSSMTYLAKTALSLGDTVSSSEVAKEYMTQLKKQPKITKDNIEFLYEYTKSSKDKGFNWFYHYADSINKIMGDDTYSQQFVKRIINNEIVFPEVNKAKKTPGSSPNWDALNSQIRKKYNGYYAGMVISASRSSWGLSKNNMPEYTKWLVVYVDDYGSKTNTGLFPSLELNNYAWAIVESTDDHIILERALSWSGRAVLMYPMAGWMDTYACILYKLKRKDEALMWEDNAVKLSPDNKGFHETLAKMKTGKPILDIK